VRIVSHPKADILTRVDDALRDNLDVQMRMRIDQVCQSAAPGGWRGTPACYSRRGVPDCVGRECALYLCNAGYDVLDLFTRGYYDNNVEANLHRFADLYPDGLCGFVLCDCGRLRRLGDPCDCDDELQSTYDGKLQRTEFVSVAGRWWR
jgi:hypothetical protein